MESRKGSKTTFSMTSSQRSNPLLVALLASIYFIIQLFYKFPTYCSRLLRLTTLWLKGCTENGKTLGDIPGPNSLPLFGTTLASEAFFPNLTQNTENLIKKYGPLIKFELFWKIPIILVYDGDDIDYVVKNSSKVRPPVEIVKLYRESRLDRYHSVGIVNTQFDEWHKLRSVLFTTIQSPKYIGKCVPCVDEISNDFINLLKTFKNGKIDSLDVLIGRYAAENAFLHVVGSRMGFLEDEIPNKMKIFISSQEHYFKALHTSFYGFPWWKYIPGHPIWTEFSKCEDTTYKIFSSVVEEEKQNGPKGLLKFILESPDIHELDKPVLAMDCVLGAIETVLNSTLFTMNFITSNPEVQEKLYNELKNVLPKKDSLIDQNILTQLPYLKSCILEAFRLCPTAPNLARLLERNIEMQGHNIPAYTVMICQHWHSSRQDKNFYKANEYIPERWMCGLDGQPREEEFLPHRGKLYHFGYGKRDCPGRRFAFMQICAFLAKLFRNYKVEFETPVTTKFEFLQVRESCPIKAILTESFD